MVRVTLANAGATGGRGAQAHGIWHSRGGLTTRIHAAVDALGLGRRSATACSGTVPDEAEAREPPIMLADMRRQLGLVRLQGLRAQVLLLQFAPDCPCRRVTPPYSPAGSGA